MGAGWNRELDPAESAAWAAIMARVPRHGGWKLRDWGGVLEMRRTSGENAPAEIVEELSYIRRALESCARSLEGILALQAARDSLAKRPMKALENPRS